MVILIIPATRAFDRCRRAQGSLIQQEDTISRGRILNPVCTDNDTRTCLCRLTDRSKKTWHMPVSSPSVGSSKMITSRLQQMLRQAGVCASSQGNIRGRPVKIEFEIRSNPVQHAGLQNPVQGKEEPGILPAGQVTEMGIGIKDRKYFPAHRVTVTGNVAPADTIGSCLGSDQRREHLQKRGLAGPVPPENADHFSCTGFKRNVGNSPATGIPVAEAADFYSAALICRFSPVQRS